MSRYGTYTATANVATRQLQSSDALDLQGKVNAAIAGLPVGYVVMDLALAGGGDGHVFVVNVEAVPAADVQSGGFVAPPSVVFFSAGDALELARSRAFVAPGSGNVADSQLAGGTKGAVFFGMVVLGTVNGENGIFGGGVGTVGFAPGKPQSENIYPTWAEAYEVLSRSQGPRILWIDDSVAPAIVPAGVWDLDEVSIFGRTQPLFSYTLLTFDDGASITANRFSIGYQLEIRSMSVTPVWTMAPDSIFSTVNGARVTNAPATAPFFDIPAGMSSLTFADFSGEMGDGLVEVVSVGAAGFFVFFPFGGSQLNANAVQGAGNIVMVRSDEASTISLVQPGLGGAIIQTNDTDAAFLEYTAANAGDWAGVNPSSVANALDRIAAALGPIP